MIQAGHIDGRLLKTFLALLLIFPCSAASLLHAQNASVESDEAQLQTQTQSDSARHPSPDPTPQSGRITGTGTDVNALPIPGALVNLHASDSDDVRAATTNANGYYQFLTVEPRRAYQISIRAAGFAQCDSPAVTVDAGLSTIVDVTKLQIQEVQTSI